MLPTEEPPQPVVTWILVATIVAFAWLVTGFLPSDEAILRVAWSRDALEQGQWHRLATSVLAHGGPLHLLFNALALLSFGSALEPALGRGRFLAVLALSGVAGNLAHAALVDGPVVGASGAIFGLIGVVLILAPNSPLNIFVFELPAMIVCSVYLAVVLLVPAFSTLLPIAHAAHLGGLAAGVLGGFATNPIRALRSLPYVALALAAAFLAVGWFTATDPRALGDAAAAGDFGTLASRGWPLIVSLVGFSVATIAVGRSHLDD